MMTLICDLGYFKINENNKKPKKYGVYQCSSCEYYFQVATTNVNSGNTNYCRKCGFKNSKKITHGESSTRLYGIWEGMKQRCTNPKATKYEIYGGRGIIFCEDWADYVPFRDWAILNGYSDELSIDRVDSDGNYEPSNCRWATLEVQNANTRIYRKNNTSGYRGLIYDKRRRVYKATIGVNGKYIYLGAYAKPLDAAIMYDAYVIMNNLPHTTNGLIIP